MSFPKESDDAVTEAKPMSLLRFATNDRDILKRPLFPCELCSELEPLERGCAPVAAVESSEWNELHLVGAEAPPGSAGRLLDFGVPLSKRSHAESLGAVRMASKP